MNLTSTVGPKDCKSPRKTREIRDGIFKEASKPSVEQAVAQFVFEFPEGPAFQVLEDDTAQQTIGSDSRPAKILRTKASPAQLLGSQLQQFAVLQKCIQLVEGYVLDGRHLFSESEIEQRGLSVGAADHYLIDVIY